MGEILHRNLNPETYKNISKEMSCSIDKEIDIRVNVLYSVRMMSAAECISAEQRTEAQLFRCNYDMKNGEARCHINHFVI